MGATSVILLPGRRNSITPNMATQTPTANGWTGWRVERRYTNVGRVLRDMQRQRFDDVGYIRKDIRRVIESLSDAWKTMLAEKCGGSSIGAIGNGFAIATAVTALTGGAALPAICAWSGTVGLVGTAGNILADYSFSSFRNGEMEKLRGTLAGLGRGLEQRVAVLVSYADEIAVESAEDDRVGNLLQLVQREIGCSCDVITILNKIGVAPSRTAERQLLVDSSIVAGKRVSVCLGKRAKTYFTTEELVKECTDEVAALTIAKEVAEEAPNVVREAAEGTTASIVTEVAEGASTKIGAPSRWLQVPKWLPAAASVGSATLAAGFLAKDAYNAVTAARDYNRSPTDEYIESLQEIVDTIAVIGRLQGDEMRWINDILQ